MKKILFAAFVVAILGIVMIQPARAEIILYAGQDILNNVITSNDYGIYVTDCIINKVSNNHYLKIKHIS